MSGETTQPVRRRKKSVLMEDATSSPPRRAAAPEEASPVGKIVATLVVVGALVGAYVMTQGDATPSSTIASVRPTSETQDTVPAVAEAVEPVQSVETVVETPPEVQLVQMPTGASACEGTIYTTLSDLQRAALDGATWGSHRQSVTQLVQAVINCEGASLDLNGELNQLGDDGATLYVAWDSVRSNLALDVVLEGAEAPEMLEIGPHDAALSLQ